MFNIISSMAEFERELNPRTSPGGYEKRQGQNAYQKAAGERRRLPDCPPAR
jgi:hypothetical protein